MPILKPVIRRATPDDVETLAEFNCLLARESENKELNADTVLSGVRRGLQQGDEVVYYVAEVESQVVGSLMLTREWSDWRDGWIIWLQSVYVRAPFRRQGVFRTLLNHVTKLLDERSDVVVLRLYVERNNTRAMAVYTQSGFVDSDYKVLEK